MKIDIYVKNFNTGIFDYVCSTMQSKTCKEAKERYCEKYKSSPENVKAKIAKK